MREFRIGIDDGAIGRFGLGRCRFGRLRQRLYSTHRLMIGHYLLIDHPQYLPVMGTCVSVERD
jgi:hypothetical protein